MPPARSAAARGTQLRRLSALDQSAKNILDQSSRRRRGSLSGSITAPNGSKTRQQLERLRSSLDKSKDDKSRANLKDDWEKPRANRPVKSKISFDKSVPVEKAPDKTSISTESVSKPSTIKRVRSAGGTRIPKLPRSKSSITRTRSAGSKLKRDTRSLSPSVRRPVVVMTLPTPRIVYPRNNSPMWSVRNKVPPLLSASAQRNLERSFPEIYSSKAPDFPGDNEEEEEQEELGDEQEAFLWDPRGQKERQKRKRPRSKLQSLEEPLSSQQLAFSSDDGSDDDLFPDDESGFNRISDFHIEVSESFSPEDEEILPRYLSKVGEVQMDPRNIAVCIVSFIVMVLIGFGSWLSPNSGGDVDFGESVELSRLETVRERGVVRCGMTPHFESKSPMSDDLHGFNIEQCRAMAWLSLGNASKYETVVVDMDTRFELLANETVDIVTEGTTYTM